MAAPTYPHAALGFRAWMVRDQLLLPLSAGPAWQPGVNRASCHPGGMVRPYEATVDGHQAPGAKCHCGFNAYHRLDRAYETAWNYIELGYDTRGPRTYVREYTIALGAIAGRGSVQIHQQGFRAAEAQILALSLVHEDQPLHELVEAAALRYRVPLVETPLHLSKQIGAITGVQTIPEKVLAPSWLHRMFFKN